jgi:transcriptional regulator with XRE-family HTH domain
MNFNWRKFVKIAHILSIMYQNIKSTGHTMLDIAKRCKVLRKQRGISQIDLAQRTRVSLSSIKRFESKGTISFESLIRIAAVLGRLEDFEKVFESKEPDLKTIKAFDI